MKPPLPESPAAVRSWLPLTLALLVLAAILAVLSLLTLGFAGVIVAVVLAMVVVIGLQYLLWGWWLTGYLQRREAVERARSAGAEGAAESDI